MSRVVVNEIEAKVGNDISFNDTVKIDTIKGKTTAGSVTVQGEGSSTTNLQQGLCKSWVNFDGSESPLTNRDSFNVSSLVDNGTGNYDQVYTNNMSSANYSVTGTGADNIPIASNRDRNFEMAAESTSQSNLNFFMEGQKDMNHVYGQIFGDLS